MAQTNTKRPREDKDHEMERVCLTCTADPSECERSPNAKDKGQCAYIARYERCVPNTLMQETCGRVETDQRIPYTSIKKAADSTLYQMFGKRSKLYWSSMDESEVVDNDQ